MPQKTDEQLMEAVRDGDVESLGVLFDRHGGRLCGYLARVTRDDELSQDLAQDVFVRVLTYRHTYQSGRRFSPWLYTIAHNVLKRNYRPMGTVTSIDDVAHRLESSTPSPLVRVENSEERRILGEAFAALAMDKREILTLGYIEQTPYAEIAAMLDISVSAVKVRVHRAVKELRQHFMRITSEGQRHGS